MKEASNGMWMDFLASLEEAKEILGESKECQS